MKVLNLQCEHQHAFEGWFASEDDYQDQLARGLIECPMCGSHAVVRLPSAPRLNLSSGRSDESREGGREPVGAPGVPAVVDPHHAVLPAGQAGPAAVQAAWLALARELMARTEDVGERFADEARRMHYGELPERGIRGRATAEQARELLEEGVPVLPLPLPAALKGPVH